MDSPGPPGCRLPPEVPYPEIYSNLFLDPGQAWPEIVDVGGSQRPLLPKNDLESDGLYWATLEWPKWYHPSACRSGNQVLDTPHENQRFPWPGGPTTVPTKPDSGSCRARPGETKSSI